MKKIAIGVGILIVGLFLLSVIGRFTGSFLMYKVPTPANEPNINVGDLMFVTNIKDYKVGDFIAYKSKYMDSALLSFELGRKNGDTYMHRLVAKEGDVIKMKNGVLFLNESNFDGNINLKHYYKISKNDFNFLPERVLAEAEKGLVDTYEFTQTDSIIIANLTTQEVKEAKFTKKPILFNPSSTNDVFMWADSNKKNWTTIDFGPIKIPKDCGFVLGDNRDNSFDSRYCGFLKLEDIKGVKL